MKNYTSLSKKKKIAQIKKRKLKNKNNIFSVISWQVLILVSEDEPAFQELLFQ